MHQSLFRRHGVDMSSLTAKFSSLFLVQEINPRLEPVYCVSFRQTSEVLSEKSFICSRSFKQSSVLLLAFCPYPVSQSDYVDYSTWV